MDPTKAFADLLQAVRDGDRAAYGSALGALAGWHVSGGFLPPARQAIDAMADVVAAADLPRMEA